MTTIEKLKEKDKNLFFNFLKKNWKKNYILTKNNNLFKWQFYKNSEYNFYIAKNKKKIVSCLGYVNDGFFDKTIKKKDDRFWLVNWITIPNQGYAGIHLLNFFLKKKTPGFVGTIGCNYLAKNIYKKLGFKVGYMNFGFVSKFEAKTQLLKHKKKININLQINKKIILKKYMKNNKVLNFMSKKSELYIKKRYLEHPKYLYKVYQLIYKGFYKGFIVVRKENYKSACCLKIIDFDLSDLSYLKSAMILLLESGKYEYCSVYYYFIKNSIKNVLKLMKYNNNLIVPHYFHPFKRSNIKNFQTIMDDI